MKEPRGNLENLKFGQFIVQKIEQVYPPGQYLFALDAGCCGTFYNAQYLSSRHRRFLVSVPATQPTWLWTKFMHKGLIIEKKTQLNKGRC
jgi:hypothetical protein